LSISLGGQLWTLKRAFMDFRLVLNATDQPVKYEDASRQYRFEDFKATGQLEETTSVDFAFKTAPP
jgi:hypothetical protein